MSTNWFKDMQEMHKKYGVNKWMQAEKQSDVDIRRVLPANYRDIHSKGKSNSDWHKDIRGKQIKIMIYLTDFNEICKIIYHGQG